MTSASSASKPLVVAEDLVKTYEGKVVLDHVSLHVDRGETLVVVGGSGAGKSTLIRQLVGLEKPDSGRVVIDGIDLDVRLYAPGTLAAAYRRVAGADAAARSGSPACARGVPDERAWSSAALPRAGLGRYRCLFEGERAAMWWTRGVRLEHAVARDGDLAALFSWWRTHPSE